MLKRFFTTHLPVILLGLIPFFRLIYLGFSGDEGLGANPIEFVTRSTGTWALVFLCITLSITPLRKIFGISKLQQHRRTLGLLMFFYALCHFSIWFWLDHNFDFVEMIKDVYKRPFITIGFLTFLLTVPLALTSNQWSIRLLKKRWSKLHKLVYLIAIGAILHFFWHKAGKNDFSVVGIYAAVIGILLGYRLLQLIRFKMG
jgi:methionine sulfoxide reductase heme-binding subunit